jgi:hypothetical protein
MRQAPQGAQGPPPKGPQGTLVQLPRLESHQKKPVPKKAPAPAKVEDENSPAKRLEALFKQAGKVKVMYVKATSSARTLISCISGGDPNYAWAKNPENLGQLQAATDAIDSKITSFVGQYLIQTPASLKGSIKPERLMVNLKEVTDLMAPCQQLAKLVEKKLGMHVNHMKC